MEIDELIDVSNVGQAARAFGQASRTGSGEAA